MVLAYPRFRNDGLVKILMKILLLSIPEGQPTFRIKRSISIGTIPYEEEAPLNPHRVLFKEEAAWMYDVNQDDSNNNGSTAAVTTSVATPKFNMANLFNSGKVSCLYYYIFCLLTLNLLT